MQLVKSTRDALLKPLSLVVGIVERRHTLPILANILIRKAATTLSFMASDLDMQITTCADFAQADLDTHPENVALTVSARKLQDILRALPDTSEVKLAMTNDRLLVQHGKSRFTLQTLNASDFPTMTQPERWEPALTLPQKTLRHLLNMVYFAMAQQDIRYYLNGMLMVFAPGLLQVVTTDGHRLAYCATDIEGIEAANEVIIPRKTVLELQRLLEESDAPVTLEVAPNQIRFRFGEVELISKLVDGKFPNFTRIIPSSYTRHFLIDRETLQRSLQRAAILTTDKLKGVRIQLAQNHMKISASNAEQEEAQEELEINYDHEPLDVGFNVNYLLDVLANVKTQAVKWLIEPNQNASTLITLPEHDQFKYVVMPMRI